MMDGNDKKGSFFFFCRSRERSPVTINKAFGSMMSDCFIITFHNESLTTVKNKFLLQKDRNSVNSF